ncbi:FlgB family protein [Pseudooctadecabacter jejudonensis]|uniref:Flagellar basal body rod protein FlgB n=1 Tax=Pseudooctadecabacter jejudonensis TaxID=1391910 RepID=A0A1Y5S5M6_9RHOB|nr:FlgB family protein [Pseudooctadecabacter jejudonensis]SLN31878.1 flagellar basal body rod protein FlgB [Pseudooctadecabacter jejudonensis]
MFKNLSMFETSFAMARHAGARQAVTAANIANADTPGYRAQSIAPFRDTYQTQGTLQIQSTRAGHLAGQKSATQARAVDSSAEPAPNGNSVSLELEMVNAVEIQREHSRAMMIYKHSLDVMRMSISRR